MKQKFTKIVFIVLIALLFITIFTTQSYASRINPTQITGEVPGADDSIDIEFRDKAVDMLRFIRNICCSRSINDNRN